MVAHKVRDVTGYPVAAICGALRIARQTAYYMPADRPRAHYRRAADGAVLQQIHAGTNSRATYGYRREWAMVNRQFRTGYNRQRIRRVMRMHGLRRRLASTAATGGRIWARGRLRRRTSAGARTSF